MSTMTLNLDSPTGASEEYQIYELDWDNFVANGNYSLIRQASVSMNDIGTVNYITFDSNSTDLSPFVSQGVPNLETDPNNVCRFVMNYEDLGNGHIGIPYVYSNAQAMTIGVQPTDWGSNPHYFRMTTSDSQERAICESMYNSWSSNEQYYLDTGGQMVKVFYLANGYSFAACKCPIEYQRNDWYPIGITSMVGPILSPFQGRSPEENYQVHYVLTSNTGDVSYARPSSSSTYDVYFAHHSRGEHVTQQGNGWRTLQLFFHTVINNEDYYGLLLYTVGHNSNLPISIRGSVISKNFWAGNIDVLPPVPPEPPGIYSSKRFYGALRIKPEINFEVNSDGKLQVSLLNFVGIDAAAKSLFDTDNEIIAYRSNGVITEDDEQAVLDESDCSGTEPALGNLDIYDAIVKQAYYLGEIPSYCNLSANRPIFVYDEGKEVIGEGKLIKIGNYLPKNFANYYTDKSYYDQQKVPSGARPTDYLLNLTITGSTHKSTVKSIYGGSLGSGNIVPWEQCYYFSPVVNSKNSYSFAHNSETSDMLSAADYRERGFSVIADYISNDTTPTSITYFIAGVGIKPWHNTEPNTLFQGYWATTVLTHMYRYIPVDFESYIDPAALADAYTVYKDGFKIGSLQCLGAVNKREQAFSIDGGAATDTFVLSGGTTWRLPQLNPQKEVAAYLIYTEELSQITYFIDPNAPDSHLATVYNDGGIEAVTEELNTNYEDYIDGGQYASELMTVNDVKIQLRYPSGVWCVFDGNSSVNHGSNVDTYRKQKDRREVAYTGFNFVDGNLEFVSPYKGREIGQSSFVSIDPSDNLLPNGYNGMNFRW